ncbi:L-arabinose-binding periplasmic protein [Escherichia coli]|nr:L-arabinose-binding periplasmic protein [Escherichia coli]
MHKFTKALAAIGLAAVMSQSAMAENLKLGFLVKQPEEPWFQTEWKFADKAGKDLGFEVIKIAVPDGEKNIERYRQPGCQWRERFRYLYSGPETRLCHRGESAWLRYESHCRG